MRNRSDVWVHPCRLALLTWGSALLLAVALIVGACAYGGRLAWSAKPAPPANVADGVKPKNAQFSTSDYIGLASFRQDQGTATSSGRLPTAWSRPVNVQAPFQVKEVVVLEGPRGASAMLDGRQVRKGDRLGPDARLRRLSADRIDIQTPSGPIVIDLKAKRETVDNSEN